MSYLKLELKFFLFCVMITNIWGKTKKPDVSHLYRGYELYNFINFGPFYGDEILSKCDDCFEGPIKTRVPFPFMGTNYTSFYINSNGVISFENSLEYPEQILTDDHNISYIAPLWIDVDTRYNGDIFHREIIDDTIKNDLKNEIKSMTGIEFELKFVYCITWYNAEPFPRYNELMNNTYQTILASDEENSIALFQYGNLIWPNYVIKKQLKTGYFKNSNEFFLMKNFENFEIDLNRSNSIVIDLQRSTTMNKTGRWILRIDKKGFLKLKY